MYKSLFSRLTLSFFIILLLIAVIIFITLNTLVNEEPQRQFSEKLLRYMVSEMGTPPEPGKLQNFANTLGVSLMVTGVDGFHWQSKIDFPDAKALENLTSPDTRFDFIYVGGGYKIVLIRHNGYNFFISDFIKKLSTKGRIALVSGVLAILLVLYLNYRFIHWLFHPIKQLKADVLRISEGDIEHHIHTQRNDELGELTQSVNAMADNLRANIRNKRELLLAISHELRTPLARAKMYLSLMPDNEYQAKLDKNLNELNQLIEALLQSESLEGSANALQMTEFDLNILIQELVKSFDTQRINMTLTTGACFIKADELRIKLLLSNVLNNALHYSEDEVEIVLSQQHQKIHIQVRDYGEGIAEKDIKRLTEAFYRPDKSRQRKTGSHGLGLYLCQKIVAAHNGQLMIKSTLGEGTTIDIVL